MSVDPLVDETGQPYAYTGDDPANRSDPTGQISAGTICGEDGPKSAACRGAEQISNQVGREVAANQVSGCVPTIDIAGSIGNFIEHHYGEIVTVAAIGVAFVPGVDLIELGAAATIALSARVANRSTNDGSAPWSTGNLGPNVVDVVATVGSFGIVSAPAAGADPILDSLGSTSQVILKVRLALPDLFGLGFDFVANN